jgi:hypothetical protein
LNRAQRAFCAAAILARPAALIPRRFLGLASKSAGLKLVAFRSRMPGRAEQLTDRYIHRQFHHGRRASICSSSITTFSYYKSPVDYSKSIAPPVEASMLSSSRDSPRTLSSILSGEGLYEMEHGGSQLAFPTLLAINCCERWRGSRNERGRLCRPSWWFNSIPRLHPSRLR